jgi:transmembrane sensor
MKIEADADIRRKEAVEWFARLNQRKVTTADVRGFSDWRRDPENSRAFQKVEAMWDAAGALAGNPDMAALTAEVVRTSKARRPRPSGLLVPLGAAGAAALAICVFSVAWLQQGPVSYTTAVGEQRTVQLEDGSRIVLDTNSAVAVRYTRASRSVTLTSGQAMFDVEGDVARPFIVSAGDTRVTAIGTRFDVRRSGSGARVILVDGRVAVRQEVARTAEWSLEPGQQVTTSAEKPRVIAANVPAATSWTVGRLTFEDTPISVAVAEVNRYSLEPIELRDPRISEIRVSGVFNAGDIDGFVAALTDLYPLKATRGADGRIVLAGGV